MHLVATVIIFSVTYFKGNWRNWKHYALTIHYVIACNLLYNVLCFDYRLWQYKPDLIPKSHVVTDLIYTFINLPALTLLFLTFYPYSKERIRQVRYIGYWVIASFIIEYPFIHFGKLILKNGYHYWMDFFFYIVMYSMIRLHHTRPLLTYGLSIIIIVFMLFAFMVPIK